jgi:hypothetical protein
VETAEAQELQLTGPLAGAPAVRKLRLYREGRFEVAPAVTFTLLDEYQRQILIGLRLNYNLTDWLALGVYGVYGGSNQDWPLRITTSLTDEIQDVNAARDCRGGGAQNIDCRLTAVNLGADFKDQLGGIDWILAPQVTAVPFRGKIALFQSIYVDSDLYFFLGPAFIGVGERRECGPDSDVTCEDLASYERTSRVAIAPTFGLGFSFYVNKWNAIGFEWRALPFAWNTGGFDTRGGGKDEEFPDNAVDSDDREFHFSQLLTLSYNFYFPQEYRVSE